jgi:hypothetical protein
MIKQTSKEKLVHIPTGFSVHSEEPFKARNTLVNHPLFEDDRIKELLRRMPREHIEVRSVPLRKQHDASYKRGEILNDIDPVEAFENLLETPRWILLHHMWTHDKDINALMHDYAGNLMETVPDMGEDISDLGCWLFLSAGEIVVHFHADPDQSFLNQIRGSKTAYVYPAKILPETAVEALAYTGNQGAVIYQPEYESAIHPSIHLAPGDTVFLPLFAPHRVINDGGLSVSWNVGFHTRKSRYRRAVHQVNHELRYFGLNPIAFNQNPVIDKIKHYSHYGFRAKNKYFPSLKPPTNI